MYVLVHWEDLYVSLISLENVKHPRKPLQEYAEGDYILATYGKRPFKARISEINGTYIMVSIHNKYYNFIHINTIDQCNISQMHYIF